MDYTRVLDDRSYEKDISSRRAMYPHERMLSQSCLEQLDLAREEYTELISRCGPLSDRTKQSLEINEEDHGKAIMVFTIVTVVFLPLSFVTSYLGMNTTDIRDMGSNQSLFYIIAIPLTVVTVGACLLVGYNGDQLRDGISSLYRAASGKQDQRPTSRGISVAQRRNARKLQNSSSSTLDYSSLADDAEYASPRPEYCTNEYGRITRAVPVDIPEPAQYIEIEPATTRVEAPVSRTRFETQNYTETMAMPMRRSRVRLEREDPFLRTRARREYDERPGYAEVPERMEYVTRRRRFPQPEEQVAGYTWHKKREHGRGGRDRETRRTKTWGEGRQAYRGY